ncbi:MAG: teicoplanin resistance protein VanZ [Candidatus Hydrogenedentota bacterium]|nr:MAG: teicoplanin resistance protein VanZ [Candidatus Hydrogenedentota bacterium]
MPKLQIRYAVLTALYCTGIFVLSAQSDPPVPKMTIPGMDKVAHAVLYAGLAFVLSWGLWKSNKDLSRRIQFWLPIAFVAFYGMTDEVHQLYVPHREFEVLDWVADVAGAFGMQWVLCRVLWKMQGEQTKESAE